MSGNDGRKKCPEVILEKSRGFTSGGKKTLHPPTPLDKGYLLNYVEALLFRKTVLTTMTTILNRLDFTSTIYLLLASVYVFSLFL